MLPSRSLGTEALCLPACVRQQRLWRSALVVVVQEAYSPFALAMAGSKTWCVSCSPLCSPLALPKGGSALVVCLLCSYVPIYVSTCAHGAVSVPGRSGVLLDCFFPASYLFCNVGRCVCPVIWYAR